MAEGLELYTRDELVAELKKRSKVLVIGTANDHNVESEGEHDVYFNREGDYLSALGLLTELQHALMTEVCRQKEGS